MQIPLSRPDVTEWEIERVVKVLRSPHLSLGPTLRQFEHAFATYMGRRHAVAVNRGTSGRWLAHEQLGYNFRLSDIDCALGLAQLSRIDEIKARRRRVAAWYQEMLAAEDRLIVPQDAPGREISWFVFVVQLTEPCGVPQRDRILQEMERRGIQVGNCFPSVHLRPFLAAEHGYAPGDFPIAESVSRRTIALPLHNRLTQDEVATARGALRVVLDAILWQACPI